MRTLSSVASAAVVAASILAVACGGRTLGEGGTGPGGSSSSGSSSTTSSSGSGSNSSTIIVTTSGSETCIDFELSPADVQCATDSDCTSVNTGLLCPGDCLCGGTAANESAQTRQLSETASFPPTECGCPAYGEPTCVSGTCTLCPFDGCGPSDAGGPGFPDVNDQACATVDVTHYDTTCNTASDCMLISTGQVCSGACECGDTPVNVDGQAQYSQATQSIMFADCPCAFEPLQCVNGQCQICGDFSTCPDAGF